MSSPKTVQVWRLMTTYCSEWKAEAAVWCSRAGVIGVGWDVGDLSRQIFSSPKDLTKLCREAHPDSPTRQITNGGRTLWNFCYEVQKGDLIILSTGAYRFIVMQVVSDYYYHEYGATYHPVHRRRAEYLRIDPDVLWRTAGRKADGERIYNTLIRCANKLTESEVVSLLNG